MAGQKVFNTNMVQNLHELRIEPAQRNGGLASELARKTVIPLMIVLCLLVMGSDARGITQQVNWTGAGSGANWSDPNNWNPVLGIPPINELIASIQFEVDIQSPACGATVDFNDLAPIPNPAYVLGLTLGASCVLDIELNTNLTVCDDPGLAECDTTAIFGLSGVFNGIGGDFTADFITLPGNSQRILASAGSAVDLGGQTFPRHAFDSSGVGINLKIISADGVGTSLTIHSIDTINSGFNDSNGAERFHQVIASNGATLSLPELLTTLPPARFEDVLYLSAATGSLLLPKLNSITGVGGKTRVTVTESTLDLPQLETIVDTQFLLGTNGVVNLVHDLGFGPANMSTLGVGINTYIIDAPSPGSVFNGLGLETLDTSWNDSNGAARWQDVQAANGGSVILSSLVSVLPPARFEDWLFFDCLGGSMNLDALQTVPATGGKTRFRVEGCTVQLPSLQESGDLAVLLGPGGVLDIDGLTDLSFDSRGLGINVDIIHVDNGVGAGAIFNGLAYTDLNAGWNDSNGASRWQQIIANNGGLVDLSRVETVFTPARVEDILYLSCNTGGELALDSLRSVQNPGRIFFNLDACIGTVADVEWAQRTDVQLTNGADFTILEDLRPRGTSLTTLASSTLTVDRDVILVDAPGAPTFSATDSSLIVGRHFVHDRQTVADVALGDSTVTMNGTEGYPGLSYHAMEVAGLDVTSVCGLLADDNFGFGEMIVGENGVPTTVGLYESTDNGHRNGLGGAAEALYLFGGGGGTRCARGTDGLFIEAGSTLSLKGVDAYVWDASAVAFVHLNSLFPGSPDPNVVTSHPFGPGTIEMVPEPGVAGCLLAGITLLSALGRQRRLAERISE
jgi:hypothetical protein